MIRTAQKPGETRSALPSYNNLWTSENTVKSPIKDLVIPDKSIPEHVWENLDRWADKTAIVCGVANYFYTYHQLYKYSHNFAVKLRLDLQIRDDDVVCIMMPNNPDYAIAILGILQAGAIVTTINPSHTAQELQKQFLLSDPKVIISVPEIIDVLKEGLNLAKMDVPIIINKKDCNNLPRGTISFEELYLDSSTDHCILNGIIRKKDDVAFLLYSSGTTGFPKAVELTHGNIMVCCAQQDVDAFKLYNDTTSSNQDSILAVLPFYHVYAITMIMLHKLSVGIKIVTLPRFHPSTFLTALRDHKLNFLCATPPIVLFLGSSADVKTQHLESVKTIMYGAAPTPMSDIIKILEKAKHNIDFIQIYGMTETTLAVAILPGSNDYSTVGFAAANTELRVVDNNLRNLGPNEAGELLIRGPQRMKGYKNNPEATKATITEDGWLRSGDLARINEEGAVTIQDRIKDLIKVKGFQVSPAELENVLKEHPDILDAAVIGVPDNRYGEVPKAFIVLKDGRKIETQELLNFVANRVAEYKMIKEIIILDSLPKNPSGKVLKRILKDKFGKIVSFQKSKY